MRRFGHVLVHHEAPADVLEFVSAHLRAAADDLDNELDSDRLTALLAWQRMKVIVNGEPPQIPAVDETLGVTPLRRRRCLHLARW
ncbi:MAG: hypothetical protein AB7O92_31135 [Acidimicrobiia bacterium]